MKKKPNRKCQVEKEHNSNEKLTRGTQQWI